MRRAKPLDVDYILDRIHVDLNEGRCFWKDATKHHARLNGKEAGSARPGASQVLYWVIKIDGVARKRSQIVFAAANGYWSEKQVVHKNGDSLDDRAGNLVEMEHHGGKPPSTIKPGDRFGMLVAKHEAGRSADKHRKWLCICDCGGEKIMQSNCLQTAKSPSCGCMVPIVKRLSALKHGHHRSYTYSSWQAAIQRCNNQTSKDYKNYGGRGIKLCDQWANSFEEFLAHMGERPLGTSLGRIDNNGNYEPGNCRWETAHEQSTNKRNSTFVEWRGQLTHITEVAKELGITNGAAHMRSKRGKLHENTRPL